MHRADALRGIFRKSLPMSATERSPDEPNEREALEQPDEPGQGDVPPALLFQVAYCSRAAPGVDTAAVDRLVAAAREHNLGLGITGLLVFGGGIFFQWIEGPRDAVARLMARIQDDVRHESLVLLSESEEVRDRVFPLWDMERVAADDIRDVLEDAVSGSLDSRSQATLSRMLEQLDSGVLRPLGGN
jgi:hypothetical protein